MVLGLLFFVLVPTAFSQTVSVGLGSYRTSVPPGEVGPQNFQQQAVQPIVSSGFALPVQSNDFWSSLLYPFFGNPHSNILYAHPINAQATAEGLRIGYTDEHLFAADDYLYPFASQLTVAVDGLSADRTAAHDYGDWTVTALWEDGVRSMEATLGHGLPFVFFRMQGGDALVWTAPNPSVWFQEDEVLGLTIAGKHYGLFAPTGATWSGTAPIRSSLNGEDFLSVALLPDASPATLELFRSHAYAFVTNSTVAWAYDETTSRVATTYAYDTTLLDDAPGSVNETLTALYRHQWLATSTQLTDHTYASPRGTMKLAAGNTFTTELTFSGVLPSLPDQGDYNRADLRGFIEDVARETLPAGPTYENGKAMARFAHLVPIAEQMGMTAERDYFLSELKRRLEEWFTAGGQQEYAYNDTWDVLTGYPSGFGADNQINDHHFHAAYAIMSAATIARYDSAWAAQGQWGGMVNLLIRDANNWDRADTRFPFLRSHDAYAGHSWAAGHGDFAEGNNQESSSESMNFASAVVLWGEATGQTAIRDLGVFLHATEASAVDQYWFDVSDTVFPDSYPHVAIGMVWGGKGVHSTWFGAHPEFIHGINLLPITGGSLYLGRHPDFVIANYDEIVAERGSEPTIWKDVLWEYLALADPARALASYYSDPTYEPFDGESRAHTLHWLHNLKRMGRVDTTITADIPTYAVFRTPQEAYTHVAYNAGPEERVVTFSDGTSLTVAPRSMNTVSTSDADPNAPVALLLTDKTSGKSPLSVAFQGNKSFDPNDEELTFAWTFGDGRTSAATDTTVTFEEVGTYRVTLTVTNEQALQAADSVRIEVLGNGTPYLGAPASVPGRIEAEHYDKGGEGVAYHDTEPQNIGLAFRPEEGVDLEASNDQGFSVYWITAGEWIEYTIHVEDTGLYDIAPYVASVPGFGTFNLLIDNEDVSGTRAVLGTGGWQFWVPVTIADVLLEQGEHIMRFEFDSETDKTGWLFSLNYIQVSPSVSVGIDEGSGLPAATRLESNYPNPFNPSTEIRYALSKPSHVTLEVFNALGRRVETLVRDRQQAGNYATRFDATDLPSGVYIYRLTTESFSDSRVMVLMK